jgi:hypothetical protein
MSKVKTKPITATVDAPPESENATAPVAVTPPASPWKLELARSGTAGLKALLEFTRPPSTPVPTVGTARTDEVRAAIREFIETDPAAVRYQALSARLADAQAAFDVADAEYVKAKAAFIDDAGTAPALEVLYIKAGSLASQNEALAEAVKAALAEAKEAYAEFHERRDAERAERLRNAAQTIAQKIEQAVAPLLSEFGAARAALRNENALIWPQFPALFPEPSTADEPRPPQYSAANGVQIVADNRFYLPPGGPRPPRETVRPPVMPMMQPVANGEES